MGPDSWRCSHTNNLSVRIIPGSGRFSRDPPSSRLEGSRVVPKPNVSGNHLQLGCHRHRRHRSSDQHNGARNNIASWFPLFLSLLIKIKKRQFSRTAVHPSKRAFSFRPTTSYTCCAFPSPQSDGCREAVGRCVSIATGSPASMKRCPFELHEQAGDSLHGAVDMETCSSVLVPNIVPSTPPLQSVGCSRSVRRLLIHRAQVRHLDSSLFYNS